MAFISESTATEALSGVFYSVSNPSGYVPNSEPIFGGYFSNIDTHTGIDVSLFTGVSARIYLDTFNNTNTFGSSFRGRRFRGTPDYPSGILDGDTILHLSAGGYSENGIVDNVGSILIQSEANWTSGNNPTRFRLRLTPSGNEALVDRILVKSNGNIGLSHTNPCYLLDGSGAANFTQGLYWNGIPAATGDLAYRSELAATGSNLQNQINNISNTGSYYPLLSNPSGYLTSLSGLSTGYVLSVSGALQSQIGGYVSSSDLAATGTLLNSKIDNLSGYSNSVFSTVVNLELTGAGLQSQINNLTNQTGNYYLNSNPNGYLNSLSGLSTGYVISISGILQSQITSLDNNSNSYVSTGQTGQFYPASNPAQYIRSGDVSNEYATIINVGLTGQNLDSKINSLSGWAASATNLQSTGSNLQNQITVLNNTTGNYVLLSQTGGFASILNLAATGSNLQGQISSINNGTGAFYQSSNPSQFVNSGNLYSTGSILDGKINALSGYSNSNFVSVSITNSISENLTQTGINLGAKIDSLSGYSNSTFSTVSSVTTVSSNLTLTGATLGAKIDSLSGYSDNKFSTIVNLTQTGATLGSKIDSLSGYSNSVFSTIATTNTISSNLTSTGVTLGSKIDSLSGWSASAVNLQSTGSVLTSRIDSLSGYSNSTFASVSTTNTISSNLTSTGITLGTKIDSLSGYSNSTFATISTTNTITSNLTSTGATLGAKIDSLSGYSASIVNLASTGSALDNKINFLSGYSNSTFSTIASVNSISSNLTATGQTLDNKINSLSGHSASVVNLQSTGSILDSKINSLSGYSNNNFAAISNLTQTGIILGLKIDSLSGYSASAANLQLTGSNLQSQVNTLTNNLTSTGVSLGSKIDSLSGYSNLSFSSVKVTGSNIIPSVNITGFNGIDVFLSGGYICITGGGAAGPGGGTNVQITGSSVLASVNISGIGTISIIQNGNNVLISGSSAEGAGEVNTASNIAGGVGIFKQKVGTDLQFNNLVGGTGMNVSLSGDSVSINSTLKNIYSLNNDIGINNSNPIYDLDVIGTGNFSQTVRTASLSLLKSSASQSSENSDYNNVYMDNFAQRGILSYVNNRGIGKMVQNAFALESIHNFVPNTTTTMSIIGTTATSAGTLSHPVTFADITGAGFATNFVTAAGGGPAGIQSATSPFFLTSGITGLGAGFFYASQFQFPDASGLYPISSGINSGINFFAGMTNAATVVLSTVNAYPTAALLGFQFLRQSGVSGRVDNSIKFVSKNNGAAAAFNVQETNCPFVTRVNYAAYIYGRNDFRNGVHWMIKQLNDNLIYSGNFTGGYNTLPLVSSSAQVFLKPTIGMNVMNGARNLKLKGLYCETV